MALGPLQLPALVTLALTLGVAAPADGLANPAAGAKLSREVVAQWQTAGNDGRYTGTAQGGPVSFKVTGGGRKIQAFSARISMFCVGATIAQNHILIGFALVARVSVARDGRFVSLTHPRPNTTVHLTGRLRHARVTGEVELTVGTCAGTARYSAHRTGSR